MSIFNTILHDLGHTAESLAQDVGIGPAELEGLVGELSGCGIDIFLMSSCLGLSPIGFLRAFMNSMKNDPHQRLLHYVSSPVMPVDDPAASLTSHWLNMANLHQDTAHQIDMHIQELFAGNGSFNYSGPAADALWTSHQNYQQFSTVLINHAHTQQSRHADLSSHVSSYLSDASSIINGLPTPIAAVGVIALDMQGPARSSRALLVPPVVTPIIEIPVEIAGAGALIGILAAISEALIAILIVAAIVAFVLLLVHFLTQWTRDQHGTNVPHPAPGKSPPQPAPTVPPLTPTQQQALTRLMHDYGARYPKSTLAALLRAGFTEQQIRDMIHAGLTNEQFGIIIARLHDAELHGKDQYGLTAAEFRDIVNRMTAALNSSDDTVKTPGEVALLSLGTIISFEKKVYSSDGTVFTDIDVETPHAIIEVTIKRKGKLKQLKEKFSDPLANPKHKQIILYAPNYGRHAWTAVKQEGFKYAKTLDDLKKELQQLGDLPSSPSLPPGSGTPPKPTPTPGPSPTY